jgi:SWI/SNF-related matrix-associated actin-dependent regulator of chromatin subfamily A3
LRQITLHPGLVPSDYVDDLKGQLGDFDGIAAPPVKQITSQDKLRLQTILARAMDQMEDCPVCFEPLRDPRITTCAHYYCLECIMQVLQTDPKCPMVNANHRQSGSA